jgi:hypothetical protein
MNRDDFAGADLRNEGVYDALRFRQWRSGQARTDGMSRRNLLRALGGAGLALATAPGRSSSRCHPNGSTSMSTLRSRATDVTGLTQPDTVPFNTREYLFDAVVDHPVTVA